MIDKERALQRVRSEDRRLTFPSSVFRVDDSHQGLQVVKAVMTSDSKQVPTDHITRIVLIEARVAAKLTQKELARRLRRSKSFISERERGTVRVRRSEFLDTARALAIEPAELFARIVAKSDKAS